jgi:hypothetical protein
MPKFNHLFEMAFSLDSDSEDASDVTPAMLRDALLRRIADLDQNADWLEACGCCDTYEHTDDLED